MQNKIFKFSFIFFFIVNSISENEKLIKSLKRAFERKNQRKTSWWIFMTCHRILNWSRRTLCSKSCRIDAICSSNFVLLLKRFRFLFCVIVDEITMHNRKQSLTSYYCQFHDLKKMKYVKFNRLNDIKTIIKSSFIEYFVSIWINWRNRFQK